MSLISKYLLVAVLAVFALSEACAAQLTIIPAPLHSSVDSTRRYVLERNAGVWSQDAEAARYVVDYCNENLNFPLRIVKDKAQAVIVIENGCKVNSGNCPLVPMHELRVNAHGITITGHNSPEAAFHGVMTLLQMLPSRPGDVPVLPYTEVVDMPRFQYRGMHLDVVRHFFPASFVKQFIDQLARHKLNVFHWHLTDDQGWRIELKSHPELTETGSYRAGEIKGVFPGEYYDRPYRAFYTQEEIKDIIAYAAQRHITVVPEIDIPGHCMAVLAAHPEFSTTPDEPKHTAQTWGIFNRQNNVLAPTPQVFKFLSEVFDEVCSLFPGLYIHVGGDECAPRWWKESEAVQQYMKDNGLKTERDLQTVFMRHVQAVCRAHGKQAIGWDGGAEGLEEQDGIIESWHMRPNMPLARIDNSHKWINSSGRYFYFTSHEDSTQTELTHGRSILPVKKVYEGALYADSASVQNKHNLMGVEGCCWTEYCPEAWKVEQLVFPRIAALAEKAWLGEDTPQWADFETRLLRLLCYYDTWRIRYNPAFERSVATPRQR